MQKKTKRIEEKVMEIKKKHYLKQNPKELKSSERVRNSKYENEKYKVREEEWKIQNGVPRV